MTPIAEGYYRAGEFDKANTIVNRLVEIYADDLDYYLSLKGKYASKVTQETQRAMSVMQSMVRITRSFKQEELNKELQAQFDLLNQSFQQTRGTAQ
jgi:hypothetical protein